MGELWLAEHVPLRAEVVIKFIAAEILSRSGAGERFAREAAAAARVNSPHVVKVLDYGTSADGAAFIVMEKLEGRDLAAELEARGRIDPTSAARIVRQLAQALAKAHAAGVVHRDVKPSNVFLCDAPGPSFVKLLDFGVAKTSDAAEQGLTGTGACVGTPGYMSPEQLLGAPDVDLRADLWALGVLAFHCLTGRKPFEGETAGAIALAMHTLPLPLPSAYEPSLLPAMDAWFGRACARDPEARFASAVELAEAFAQAAGAPAEAPSSLEIEGEAPAADSAPLRTLTSAPPPGPRRGRTWRGARRPLSLAAAVVAVFAVGASLFVREAWSRGGRGGIAHAAASEPIARAELDVPAVTFPAPEVPAVPSAQVPPSAPVSDRGAPPAFSKTPRAPRARTAPAAHVAPAASETHALQLAAAPAAIDEASGPDMPGMRRGAARASSDAATPGLFVTPDVRR
jgi:hypothetical protein